MGGCGEHLLFGADQRKWEATQQQLAWEVGGNGLGVSFPLGVDTPSHSSHCRPPGLAPGTEVRCPRLWAEGPRGCGVVIFGGIVALSTEGSKIMGHTLAHLWGKEGLTTACRLWSYFPTFFVQLRKPPRPTLNKQEGSKTPYPPPSAVVPFAQCGHMSLFTALHLPGLIPFSQQPCLAAAPVLPILWMRTLRLDHLPRDSQLVQQVMKLTL